MADTSFIRRYVNEFRALYRSVFAYRPADHPVEREREFRDYSRRLTIRGAQAMGTVFVLGVLVCWPTDFVAFAGRPEIIARYASFRVALVPTMLIGNLFGELLIRRALSAYWLLVVPYVVGMIVVPFATLGAVLADMSQPIYYAFYVVPPVTVLLVLPPTPRAVITLLLPTVWLIVHRTMFPVLASNPNYVSMAVFGYFVSVCSVFVGHGFFLLVRANFLRERDLVAEREKTLEMNAKLSRLFANISHEMRTPLTVIRGNLGLLAQQADPGGDAERWIGGLDRNAARLALLVDQFLVLSKAGETQTATDACPVDPKDAIEVIIDAVFAGASEAERPAVHCGTDVALVRVVPQHLADILYNLLANAKKFHRTGRHSVRITVTVGAPVAGQVPIEVADDGRGIPPGKLNQIFRRFEQAHDEVEERRGGVGLGLAIVDELARANGGRVEVQSVEGQGSTFTVWLPVAANSDVSDSGGKTSAQKPSGHEIDEGPPGQKVEFARHVDRLSFPSVVGRATAGLPVRAEPQNRSNTGFSDEGDNVPQIVMIDDEPDMLAYLRDVLAPVRAEVIDFSDSATAIRELPTLRPDLVITDLMMPGSDGADVVREIRRHPEMERTPVMVVSAAHDPQAAVELLDLGAVDFVTKPFLESEFLARVRRQLEVARWFDQLNETVSSVEATLASLHTSHFTRKSTVESDGRGPVTVRELRSSVADELHDDLGQLITACRLELSMAERAVDMPHAFDAIRRLRAAIVALSETFRETLDALSRGQSREVSVAELRRNASLVAPVLTVTLNNEFERNYACLPKSVGSFILRAAQEGMNNALKHGNAEHVSISLAADGQGTVLEISDDGVGFDEASSHHLSLISDDGSRSGASHTLSEASRGFAENSGSTGLHAIRRRALELGGRASVKSSAGRGATLTIRLP